MPVVEHKMCYLLGGAVEERKTDAGTLKIYQNMIHNKLNNKLFQFLLL